MMEYNSADIWNVVSVTSKIYTNTKAESALRE